MEKNGGKMTKKNQSKIKFEEGDTLKLTQDHIGMAARKGATATVTKKGVFYSTNCEVYLVDLIWNRKNGKAENQVNGGYHPSYFIKIEDSLFKVGDEVKCSLKYSFDKSQGIIVKRIRDEVYKVRLHSCDYPNHSSYIKEGWSYEAKYLTKIGETIFPSKYEDLKEGELNELR